MKNKGYAKFWAANKVPYGRCASGVLRSFPLSPSRASPLSPGFLSCYRPELLSGEWRGMRRTPEQSTSFTGYNVNSMYMVLNKDPMKNVSAW